MCRFFPMFFLIIALIFSLSLGIYALDTSAKHSVLIECESGDVVYAKNCDIPVGMASTTKIMSAIIIIENCQLDKVVTIPKEAVGIEGSSIYLKEGERLTIEDLLYALLLESANDVAVALAIECAGDKDSFVNLMNSKARELGLVNTHFTNPHGLDDENHYTTARELAIIASYAMTNPIFCDIVSTYKRVIPLGDDGSRVLINHNKLLRSFDGAIGIKTGFTKRCGRCLVSCAERNGVRLIAVTLNAPNDWQDHKLLYEYGFSQYENINLASTGDYTIQLNVMNGVKSSLICSNLDSLSITIKKGNNNISAELQANRIIPAPIKQGDIVGQIVFKNNDEAIGALPLYALFDIKEIKYKKTIFERLFS